MAKILVIHGPNLNLLGMREVALYGQTSLAMINETLEQKAQALGHELQAFQSNAEGALIDKIHESLGVVDFIIINPAGLTHTSIALRDALLGVTIPFIEVHLTNIYQREPFRQVSYLSDKAKGVITGFGALGYEFALEAVIHFLKT